MFPGWDAKRDLAMHVYIYIYIYIIFVPFRLYGNNFAREFFVPSRVKRDNFYHINTPSRFAGTILC